MVNEDKELLLKDLCARLPYFVKVNIKGDIKVLDSWADDDGNYFNFLTDEPESNFGEGFTLDEVKPYLRPMSSMTEDEHKEWLSLDKVLKTALEINRLRVNGVEIDESKVNSMLLQSEVNRDLMQIDWLNARYFDYRGLIEKGLALKAPEGMYDIK